MDNSSQTYLDNKFREVTFLLEDIVKELKKMNEIEPDPPITFDNGVSSFVTNTGDKIVITNAEGRSATYIVRADGTMELV